MHGLLFYPLHSMALGSKHGIRTAFADLKSCRRVSVLIVWYLLSYCLLYAVHLFVELAYLGKEYSAFFVDRLSSCLERDHLASLSYFLRNECLVRTPDITLIV